MSFDERTQTMNIGTPDWLEASKGMLIRSYLPPTVGGAEMVVEPMGQDTQFAATDYLIPVPESTDHEIARLTEELNEVYDGEMEEEEQEIAQHVKEYHRRRLSDG